MDEHGKLIRLFPVPFRFVNDAQQFRKWQWIEAGVRKTNDDHRLESHRISVDTIQLLGAPIPTKDDWIERRRAIEPLQVFENFAALEDARQSRGVTLGLVRPSRLLDLEITRADSTEWSADEVAKLMQAQMQGSLFDQEDETRALKLLRKLPFDFRYRYECSSESATTTYRHKLVDWEAGALYWKVHRRADWELAFRQRFFDEFLKRDVLFLMGTIHRFPDQWLIVSVLYPPKPQPEILGQLRLF